MLEVLAEMPPPGEAPPPLTSGLPQAVFVLVALLHTAIPPAGSLPGILHVSMSQAPPLMWTPVMTTSELGLVHYGTHLMGFYICQILFPNEAKFRDNEDQNSLPGIFLRDAIHLKHLSE